MKKIISALVFIGLGYCFCSPKYDTTRYLIGSDVVYPLLVGNYNNGQASITQVAGIDYRLLSGRDTIEFRAYDDGYLYSSQWGGGLAYYDNSDSTFNVTFGKHTFGKHTYNK